MLQFNLNLFSGWCSLQVNALFGHLSTGYQVVHLLGCLINLLLLTCIIRARFGVITERVPSGTGNHIVYLASRYITRLPSIAGTRVIALAGFVTLTRPDASAGVTGTDGLHAGLVIKARVTGTARLHAGLVTKAGVTGTARLHSGLVTKAGVSGTDGLHAGLVTKAGVTGTARLHTRLVTKAGVTGTDGLHTGLVTKAGTLHVPVVDVTVTMTAWMSMRLTMVMPMMSLRFTMVVSMMLHRMRTVMTGMMMATMMPRALSQSYCSYAQHCKGGENCFHNICTG